MCVYVYACKCIYLGKHVCLDVFVDVGMCVGTSIYTDLCTCMYVYLCACVYRCVSVRYACVYVSTYAVMYVCMCEYGCVRVCMQWVSMCMCIALS